MPGFALALGAAIFAAFAIGGNAGQGAWSFGVMAALAALFYFGRRSETLSGLGGPGRDERWAAIDMRASAFSGLVVITAILGAWLWEIAHRDDGEPLRAARAPSPAWPTSSASRSCAGARSRYFA